MRLTNFIVLGLPFMKRVPSHFSCLDKYNGSWNPCSKQYICDNALKRDEYAPDTEEYDYIDNWQN